MHVHSSFLLLSSCLSICKSDDKWSRFAQLFCIDRGRPRGVKERLKHTLSQARHSHRPVFVWMCSPRRRRRRKNSSVRPSGIALPQCHGMPHCRASHDLRFDAAAALGRGEQKHCNRSNDTLLATRTAAVLVVEEQVGVVGRSVGLRSQSSSRQHGWQAGNNFRAEQKFLS